RDGSGNERHCVRVRRSDVDVVDRAEVDVTAFEVTRVRGSCGPVSHQGTARLLQGGTANDQGRTAQSVRAIRDTLSALEPANRRGTDTVVTVDLFRGKSESVVELQGEVVG